VGGPSADADTQTASPASSGGPAAGESRPAARRWRAVAAYLLAGAVLFAAYLRLSQTHVVNSDSANILLMGWDLLHGNLQLHGWYMSDVSFYPTELPQYALLESFLGLHMQTAHVAAAMTYTLALLLAVLLATSGHTGRPALTRALIAAGVMLAPQLGLGVFALDLSVGHIGTAVPLMLTWLVIDRAKPRWWVPVLTAVLLAWVQVADPIVYITGIGPLGLVCAARVIRGLWTGSGGLRERLAAQRYDLSLGAAAVAAAGLAWAAGKVLSASGGYTLNKLPFYFRSWSGLHKSAPALRRVLQVFGADFTGQHGVLLALALLHLASVIAVAWALARVARRFFVVSLVDQVLAVAIVANVVLYLLTSASDLAAHEVAIIVPFGAALAARVARPARPRLKLAALAAGIAALAGYTAGLGYEISQPTAPPANTSLASWLVAHHFSYGLSGYWTSSSVTVDSGNRVQVRALMQYTMKRDLWMSDVSWYDPGRHYANFIVLDSLPGFMNHWEPKALIRTYFGRPARTYQAGPYTIMVWDKNLLYDIPR
jgi:hypothetical protein